MKVIVEVRGGMVQNVYADTDKVDIKILDWDTEQDRENDILYKKAQCMRHVW